MPPKAARPPKKGSKEAEAAKAAKAASKGKDESADGIEGIKSLSLEDIQSGGASQADDGGRVATGMLISEPRARDIKIAAFSLSLHGHVLVEDTTIELNNGSRYGLVGRNGCGKSVRFSQRSLISLSFQSIISIAYYFHM